MQLEIRSDSIIAQGYVNVVERLSRPINGYHGKFTEVVKAGTFANALKANNDVKLKYNHKRVIGSMADGTLELKEDPIGLYAKATITDAEVIKSAREGKIKGWSFGFNKIKDEWQRDEAGNEIRSLCEIKLNEVSIVDITPVYRATSVEVRGEVEELIEHRLTDDKLTVTDVSQPDVKPNENVLACRKVVDGLKEAKL